MAKVETLLKLIAYQKQHPFASQKEAASALGVSPKYVWELNQEIHLLQKSLATPSLQPHQLRLLLSLLDSRTPHHRETFAQLQKMLLPQPTGVIRVAEEGERCPYGWLNIGMVIPTAEASSLAMQQLLSFWLSHLCYAPLLWFRRDGQIAFRLASGIEPTQDYQQWQIHLRKEVRFSDGVKIAPLDVETSLKASGLSSLIADVKHLTETHLSIRLLRPEPLFPLRLSSIPIRPAKTQTPYQVSSGAYQLKRFQQEGSTFRLQRRRDASFNESDIGIDGITIRRFKRFAGAIKAVERHEIDILPLQSLKLLHQTAPDLHPQQTPFFSESYYLLFLNRKKAPLRDENNCVSLAGAIDYSAISWYLHAGQLEDAPPILEPLAGTALDLKIGCDSRECLDIAQLIGKSVGVDLIHPVLSEKGGKETEGLKHADAFLTQIFFGIGFSRLSRYFHSEGRNNPFGYANPKVDELLKELDRTSDMRLRQSIAERVLSDILADFGVILLAPCYQYILSPLEIQFDENLNGLFDLVQNMTRLVVERHGCR